MSLGLWRASVKHVMVVNGNGNFQARGLSQWTTCGAG
jgi:hypothetical protein